MTMPTTEQPGLENALIAPADSSESTEDVDPTPKHGSGSSNGVISNNMNMTPQRPSGPPSAYSADLSQTPIASAKRPAALTRAGSSRRGTLNNSSGGTATTTASSSSAIDEEPLSPMHGVKTVENVEGGDCSARGLVVLHHNASNGDGKITAATSASSSPTNSSSILHHNKADEQLFSPMATALQQQHVESDDESMASPEQPDSNSDEFNPWQFIQSLPPYAAVEHQRPAVTLPPLLQPSDGDSSGTGKKTLVLDLDETLVHCSIEEPVAAEDGTTPRPPDLQFPVTFHGCEYTVYVRLRPHLQQFLETVSKQFEVVCFTASQKVYADALLDRIDPGMYYLLLLVALWLLHCIMIVL